MTFHRGNSFVSKEVTTSLVGFSVFPRSWKYAIALASWALALIWLEALSARVPTTREWLNVPKAFSSRYLNPGWFRSASSESRKFVVILKSASIYVISENAAKLAAKPPIKPVTNISNKVKSSLKKKKLGIVLVCLFGTLEHSHHHNYWVWKLIQFSCLVGLKKRFINLQPLSRQGGGDDTKP